MCWALLRSVRTAFTLHPVFSPHLFCITCTFDCELCPCCCMLQNFHLGLIKSILISIYPSIYLPINSSLHHPPLAGWHAISVRYSMWHMLVITDAFARQFRSYINGAVFDWKGQTLQINSNFTIFCLRHALWRIALLSHENHTVKKSQAIIDLSNSFSLLALLTVHLCIQCSRSVTFPSWILFTKILPLLNNFQFLNPYTVPFKKTFPAGRL